MYKYNNLYTIKIKVFYLKYVVFVNFKTAKFNNNANLSRCITIERINNKSLKMLSDRG